MTVQLLILKPVLKIQAPRRPLQSSPISAHGGVEPEKWRRVEGGGSEVGDASPATIARERSGRRGDGHRGRGAVLCIRG